MTEIFGVPIQALYGQLMLGLVNGAFYAVLSLGLAVIFGMLNIINFAHGAMYMTGAMLTWVGLEYLGIGYWWMLIVAPIAVGLIGIAIERLMLQWLYKLDHLYGLLLTFGLALMIEGLFRDLYGVAGQPYSIPEVLSGAFNLGFMFLPKYRAWVIVASLTVCFVTWFMIEKTRLGAYLRAATENPQFDAGVRYQCAADGDADLWFRCRPGGICRSAGSPCDSDQSVDGVQPDHCRVCRGGGGRHGIDSRLHRHRTGAGRD